MVGHPLNDLNKRYGQFSDLYIYIGATMEISMLLFIVEKSTLRAAIDL